MVELVRVLACACLVLTGCFYLDPLNKPPTVRPTCAFTDGRPCDSDSDVHRGDRIRLHMIVTDPDDNEDASTYGWKATACAADDGSLCSTQPYDAQHYDEQRALGVELEIPTTLASDVRSISVDFEVRDDRGGIAVAFMLFHLTAATSLEPRQISHHRQRRPSSPMRRRIRRSARSSP
jgi:hypothetical protein